MYTHLIQTLAEIETMHSTAVVRYRLPSSTTRMEYRQTVIPSADTPKWGLPQKLTEKTVCGLPLSGTNYIRYLIITSVLWLGATMQPGNYFLFCYDKKYF